MGLRKDSIGNPTESRGREIQSKGGRGMDMETIEKEIEKLPREDKSILLTEITAALCGQLLGDEACRRPNEGSLWHRLCGRARQKV